MTATSGLLLVDKPSDWTSHDVVAKVRGITGTRRVGHAGTLDPMATGLLVLGVNNATKLLTFLVGADKTYRATIRLGAATITDDRESEFSSIADSHLVSEVTEQQIRGAMSVLTGDIMQVPSSVSAIKVNGERAYAKVRGGDEVKLAARPIRIARFDVLEPMRRVQAEGNSFIDIDVEIDCSSGTYIRAIARDLGSVLGIGGHLTHLRRTRVGSYDLSMAKPLAEISRENFQLLPIADAATAAFSVRLLSDQEVVDLRHGKRISIGEISDKGTSEIAAIDCDGKLVAMLTRVDSKLKSVVVFQQEGY